MNAIELLKNDHELVKKLLGELSETTERAVKKRTELLRRIELELTQHTSIEEEIFYPALKQAGEKDDAQMYYEAKEEHRTVDALVLPDLKKTKPDSVEFAGRVKVLKELLEHHIEEEEQEMFPRAEELLDHPTLERLGAAMAQLKKDIKAQWDTRAA
ncbi:hemerythrin domain-containing protein [Pseudomonas sp. NY15437]|uniref:hemerythrin domain-containing protein n=1 Tax=unclassified Pseudomonas TaxID=196821 RepID=UPI00223B661A|nr:hemerythrin domain-containing protein [Pseudomonas sp. GCEP-101]